MKNYVAPGITHGADSRAGASPGGAPGRTAIALIWKRPVYLSVWILATLAVGGVYAGVLTDPAAYDETGWLFALAFPVLTGAMIAVLVATYMQQKACPVTAAGSGLGGGILGMFTIGCSACPAILLGWIGLGAAVPGAFLASPWLKLASLGLLVAALVWAGRRKLSAS